MAGRTLENYKNERMFRELGYGVLFFLAAAVGAALGVTVITPAVTSGYDREALVWRQALAAIAGATICGAVWFYIRRVVAPPLDWDEPN
jgi:hypothetical protein